MKKILIIAVLLLTGCTKGEEVICTIENQEAIFKLNDGIITSYTLDGKKQNQSIVDEINGTYFTSSQTNEEGKEILKEYVISLNGNCDF